MREANLMAPSTNMDQLQSLGRAEFKARNYDVALTYFNRAIDRGRSIQLLECRAACHEKLGNLIGALQDAKEQISLAPQDTTGYLRASHVLLRMQKKSRALDVCERGLKHVKHIGKGYGRLKEYQRILRNELYPRKCIDPFTFLPRELVELLLNCLSFQQRMKACLVCKSWMQFIRASPSMWQHLDLSTAPRKVRNEFFSRAINIGRTKISEVSLNGNCDLTKVLPGLLRSCQVQKITLYNTGPFGVSDVEILSRTGSVKSLSLATGTELRAQALCDLLNGPGGRLESFEVQNLTLVHSDISFSSLWKKLDNMQSFRISTNGSNFQAADIEKLLTLLPNVRNMRIHDNSSFYRPIAGIPFLDLGPLQQLQSLELRCHLHSSRLMLPPTLHRLSLSWPQSRMSSTFFDEHDANTSPVLYYLPKLMELELRVQIMKWRDIHRFLACGASLDATPEENTTKLDRLIIEISQMPSKIELEMLLRHDRLQNLNHFTLNTPLDSRSEFDPLLESILTDLPQLESMDISETGVTGVGVKAIVNRSRIKKLVLDGCHAVGRDAVDWARLKGLNVIHNHENSNNSGRKIRYGR